MMVTSILFLYFNHFLLSNIENQSQSVQEIVLNKPLLLKSDSKFHRKFVSQFGNSWRETIGVGLALRSTDKLTEQLPLYFLPNDSSCAVVVLLLEGLSVYRDDGYKFAVGETGISSDGSFIMVYGFDPSKQRYDLLFRSKVVDFHGSYYQVGSKLQVGCPQLLISSKSSANSLDQYALSFDLEHLRYVKSDASVRVKVTKFISW